MINFCTQWQLNASMPAVAFGLQPKSLGYKHWLWEDKRNKLLGHLQQRPTENSYLADNDNGDLLHQCYVF